MKDSERLYFLALICSLYLIGAIGGIANNYIPINHIWKSIGISAIILVLVFLGNKYSKAKH